MRLGKDQHEIPVALPGESVGQEFVTGVGGLVVPGHNDEQTVGAVGEPLGLLGQGAVRLEPRQGRV